MRRRAVILGSTGSIGRNALKASEGLDDIEILVLSGNTGVELLKKQIEKYRPRYAAVACTDSFKLLKSSLGKNISTRLLKGMDGVCELASMHDADTVVNGLSGIAGLRPAVEGLKASKRMALANKESIVMGWNIMKKAAGKGELIPVDSEHSALFQLIGKEDKKEISRLIITASGGAVYGKSYAELEEVTIDDCLRHPTWDMGNKITVDSATLMNKGLEIIEAHFLFDIPMEKIDILIHPQSVIHGMVEFVDGSMVAHMGAADMRIPIQYSLTYPCRGSAVSGRLSIEQISDLKLRVPDLEKFPCPSIARSAAKDGGVKNILLCAADEAAVEAFSRSRLKFSLIPDFVREIVSRGSGPAPETVEGIEKLYIESLELSRRKLGEEKWK